MRIKKYKNASSPIERLPYIRNYQWRIMPQTEHKYKDYYLDSDVFSGDRVWTDELGNIVTADTPNAAVDFAVQYRNPRFELDYPEITIEGNGKGYFTGESFADRYARELAAPIAKNADVDKTFKEQALQLHEQSKEKHDADVKAADARANQLTPGAGTFVGIPLTLTAAGIGGATLAPFLVPGTIGGNIIGTTAFGEALNQAMKYGTGKTLGEHAVNAARYLGIPESQWGDFGILMIGDLPFYVTGDLIGKQVANTGRTLTKEALDQLALDNTFKGIPINPTTKNLAKAINESVDKQSLYTPSVLHRFDNPYQITKVSGNKIRLRLPSHTQEKPREVVLVPHGNNQYELHIRTWDGDHVPANLNPQEKTALFESVYNELPEGAEILFPESSADYPATRGTVAALTHLSRDPRFQRGNTTGTLIYTDKDGNLQTFTGNSFIKRQKPIDSHLLGEASAGKYGEFYPKIESDDIKWITDEFSNMYETTPLTLYTTPILERISDDTIALGIGEFDLSNTTKAFTDIMKRRWNLYNYKFNDNNITPIPDSNFLSYVLGDGNRTFHTVDWIFNNIKNKKQILYTPTTDHSWGGFHMRDDDSNWIRWNPRISHIPTTIHETISHGTDPIVRNFVTDTGQPVLGKSTVSTLQWNPETGNFETMPIEIPSLYELLSYPIDVFNPGKVADTITGDALKDQEARASNWEMIANLYNRIAKERGITPKEAFQIPDSEFHSYVDNLSNKDIIDLLKTTNGYTMKYAKLLDTDDQYAVNNYLRLWRQALKYAPSLIPVGLYQLNQPTSNRKGGKLIPRKFQFGGFNRPVARLDNTRVVQLTPRMKVLTPRKVTRPSYNFENQSDRVRYAMYRLTSEGKFTKNQAAALLGVYLDENGLNPKTVQGKEKAGRGVKGTRGTNEYGAGPWSWTGPLKKQLLKNMGYSEDTLFENLPFNVQVDGLIASTKSGPLKNYFDTLRKYNGESASLLATIMTGGVGYLRNWNNPTLEELRSAANNMQNAYIRTNGKSDYTLNAVLRRLNNMNTILTTY